MGLAPVVFNLQWGRNSLGSWAGGQTPENPKVLNPGKIALDKSGSLAPQRSPTGAFDTRLRVTFGVCGFHEVRLSRDIREP